MYRKAHAASTAIFAQYRQLGQHTMNKHLLQVDGAGVGLGLGVGVTQGSRWHAACEGWTCWWTLTHLPACPPACCVPLHLCHPPVPLLPADHGTAAAHAPCVQW